LPGKFFSFPSFGKLITLLLLHACVSDSRMHTTVAAGSLVWTSDPTFFFTMQHKLKINKKIKNKKNRKNKKVEKIT
jgi:hypothetical protein